MSHTAASTKRPVRNGAAGRSRRFIFAAAKCCGTKATALQNAAIHEAHLWYHSRKYNFNSQRQSQVSSSYVAPAASDHKPTNKWLFMMCGPVQFRRLQLYKRHDWLSWRTKVTRRNVLHLWLRDAEFQTQLILEPDEEQVTPYDLLTNMDPNNADVADIQTMFDQALKRELGDAGGPGFKYKLPIKWKRALSSRRTRLRKSYREQDASHPSASGEDDLDSDDDMFYSASP
ncbi:uncharacterized protein MONBRDRAFT_38687 [Monosiga brevicollis MX1]|uniref:Uncharacterized protein n=1 Tax=Monosiga brevicollis TaxID=81824 RepID=A9V9E6_MONBE|nr:uncharacterized protein MONBRDRAFT_38687 [Monosiga brevicollis MX1]EDQ85847.1 predicted protein [Monosiga brevicollis MX1]|eukprot:XP_001749326.1 hypothetical protein [Monosiga brevicollis MX1]